VGLAHRDELENGIADEAFKTLPGDDKEIAAAFLKKNRQERRIREDKQAAAQLKITETIENTVQESMAEYSTFNRLPEHTPDEIAAKARAYNKFINGKGYSFLKAMADTQVAQFFIPKTTGNKHRLITDSDYQAILKGFAGWQNQQTAYAVVVAQEKRFFHWFLEFPEVFQNGGFDSILGNPPYLGGSKLSSNYGLPFIEFLHYSYSPAAGRCDLAAYFLRRNYKIINMPGFVSLITTNSINQGETRDGGLEYIQSNNGIICFAQKSIKWPGVAAVEVTLISITNNISHKNIFLDGKKVEFINSFLTSDSFLSKPYSILANKNLAFQGTNIYGKGFIIKADEFKSLINTDIKNLEVISTYLTGDEINNNPDHRSERYVINFWNRSLKESSVFSDCLNIVLSKVKPERDLVNRERYRNVWWQFGEKCENLYRSTKHLNLVITLSRVTKYINPVIVNNSGIFSDATIVFSENSFQFLALLNCTFHYEWCNFSSSALASTIRYNPSDCILTYPLPHNYNQNNKLRTIGEKYYKHRCELLLILQLGLTKTYNAFHAREITASLANPSASADLTALNMDKKSIEKKYGKEVWNLWNHLQKMEHPDKGGTSCTFEEAVAGIIHLRELHVEMDNAVLEAYGWWEAQVSPPASTAVSPPAKGEYPKGEGVREGVSLHHDFYEVDYLPENDRIRYTIHPDARKEILKRLLELNHKIHEEEVKAGLWDKKKTVKYEIKPSRNTAEEPGEGYGQGKLF
jgi:hypothetical protein